MFRELYNTYPNITTFRDFVLVMELYKICDGTTPISRSEVFSRLRKELSEEGLEFLVHVNEVLESLNEPGLDHNRSCLRILQSLGEAFLSISKNNGTVHKGLILDCVHRLLD